MLITQITQLPLIELIYKAYLTSCEARRLLLIPFFPQRGKKLNEILCVLGVTLDVNNTQHTGLHYTQTFLWQFNEK